MSVEPPSDRSHKATKPEFRFGEGKISGVLSVFLGWLALGAVVALHFPQFLSTPGGRTAYPMEAMRLLIDLVIFSALGLGVISLILSEQKTRGLLGGSLATLSLALGLNHRTVFEASRTSAGSPPDTTASPKTFSPPFSPAFTSPAGLVVF